VTPDSNGASVYHYHVQDRPPFTIGCFGPAADGGLVSVAECRGLYPSDCGDGDEVQVTTHAGTVAYDPWCPCWDTSGSNVPGAAGGGATPTPTPVPIPAPTPTPAGSVGAPNSTAMPGGVGNITGTYLTNRTRPAPGMGSRPSLGSLPRVTCNLGELFEAMQRAVRSNDPWILNETAIFAACTEVHRQTKMLDSCSGDAGGRP
jgi:hypothetical protein